MVRSVFTEYAASLDRVGEPPDPQAFDELLEALRRALVHEMKKRSLWSSPPGYLGVYGGNRWTEGDLLEELLLDCYVYIFIRRLSGIKRQLLTKSNIDGLIFLSLRNFLHERQYRHDPLGFRVFEIFRSAAKQEVGAGHLHILAGSQRIGNDTILGFSTETDTVSLQTDLQSIIRLWCDDLLPDIVTEVNKRKLTDRLRSYLLLLEEEGVLAFRFGDIIGPIKAEVRQRWVALWEQESGESAFENADRGLVRFVLPETEVEDRDRFMNLVSCVAEELERLHIQERTKKHLRILWGFLATQARLGRQRGSYRAISRTLGIPRRSLPSLFSLLREVVENIREPDRFKRASTISP